MLRLFFKAIRHKKEHTRRLPSGKVISIRAFDYNDPRTAKPKAGRGKDRATEDLFNPEYSGDLYDPKAVRAARQEAPKPVKAPRLVSARQGPDIAVPDLFATLDNAEKISYPESEASQSGEANNQSKGEGETMENFKATGKLSRGKWTYNVIMPDGTESTWTGEGKVTHLAVVEMKPGAKGEGKYRIQNRWDLDRQQDSRDAWLERAHQNEWYADARVIPVELDEGKPKTAKPKTEIQMSDISLPAGYSLSEDGQEVLLRGKFDDDLHARIKRAGGHWDGVTGKNRKLWVIPKSKLKSLARIFGNISRDKANEEAERKTYVENFKHAIPSGQYAQFRVTQLGALGDANPGYLVEFPYEDDGVNIMRYVAGKQNYIGLTQNISVLVYKYQPLRGTIVAYEGEQILRTEAHASGLLPVHNCNIGQLHANLYGRAPTGFLA